MCTQKEHPTKTKAEIREVFLQAEGHQRLLADHQRLRARHQPLQCDGLGLLASSLREDAVLFKPHSLWDVVNGSPRNLIPQPKRGLGN